MYICMKERERVRRLSTNRRNLKREKRQLQKIYSIYIRVHREYE